MKGATIWLFFDADSSTASCGQVRTMVWLGPQLSAHRFAANHIQVFPYSKNRKTKERNGKANPATKSLWSKILSLPRQTNLINPTDMNTRHIICLKNGIVRNPLVRLDEPACFDLESDEHIAIIGPNGSGKSLLVDMITGRHPLCEGTLSYDFYPSAWQLSFRYQKGSLEPGSRSVSIASECQYSHLSTPTIARYDFNSWIQGRASVPT